jgi:hypothetical protein
MSILDQLPPGTDLSSLPYMPHPDGGSSDFSKRSELLTLFIIVCSVIIAFQLLFVGFRVLVRLGSDELWRLDDCKS